MSEEKLGFRGTLVWNAETKRFEEIRRKRTVVDAPFVITDEIAPTEYLGDPDLPVFTSKRKLRERYRQDGFVEVGSVQPREWQGYDEPDEAEIRDAAERAFMDIKYDRVEFSEKEKELCRQEERAYREALKRRK